MSLLRLLSSKVAPGSSPVAGAHTAASTPAHGAVSTGHAASHAAHGHDTHLAPWEGVNLWRTPYKGDGETVTQVKRTKGFLDRYVENRTRHIQEMQLFALVSRRQRSGGEIITLLVCVA